MKPPGRERRTHRRLPASLPVEFDAGEARGSGTMADVSLGGLLLSTRSALRAGAEVRGEVVLAEGKRIPFVAHVRWMRPVRDGKSKKVLVGLKFVESLPAPFRDLAGASSPSEEAAPLAWDVPLAAAKPVSEVRAPAAESMVVEVKGRSWQALPPLAACLLEAGYLDARSASEVAEEVRRSSCSAAVAIRTLGLVEESDVCWAVARAHGLPAIDLQRVRLQEGIEKLLPRSVAMRLVVAPLYLETERGRRLLHVALSDPEAIGYLPEIETAVGGSVKPWVAVRGAVEAFLAFLYDRRSAKIPALEAPRKT